MALWGLVIGLGDLIACKHLSFHSRNTTALPAHSYHHTRKNLTAYRQDVFAIGLYQVCEQVVTLLLFHQAATSSSRQLGSNL